MAYNSLMSARSDFSSLGSSLSSIQQNALDDQISNNSSLQNYNNANLQVKLAIPSSFGEIAFGGYELLGQGKELATRLLKVKNDIIAAPQNIKDALVKGGNRLGENIQEAKNVVTTGVSDLKQVVTDAGNTVKDITNRGLSIGANAAEEVKNTVGDLGDQVKLRIAESTGRFDPSVLPGGTDDIFRSDFNLNQALADVVPKTDVSLPSLTSVLPTPDLPSLTSVLPTPDLPSLTSVLPRTVLSGPGSSIEMTDFTPRIAPLTESSITTPLSLTVKKPTTFGVAESQLPDTFKQKRLLATDPEIPLQADLGFPKSFEDVSSAYKQINLSSVPSVRGDFLKGLTPESLITASDEAILPARTALNTTISTLQNEGGGVLTNLLGAGRGAQQGAASTLASVTEKGGALATDTISAGANLASKAAATLPEVAGGLTDAAKAAATTLSETGAEVASTFLPVVGEVTALGLGAVQVYEGFRDLFDHPSASKPVTVPMPNITNIGQGFQSGI